MCNTKTARALQPLPGTKVGTQAAASTIASACKQANITVAQFLSVCGGPLGWPILHTEHHRNQTSTTSNTATGLLLEEGGDRLLVVHVIDRLGQKVRHGQLNDLGVVCALRAQRNGI